MIYCMSTQPMGSRVPEWTPGDRLRKARSIAGLGQAEFAAQLGVPAGSLANWETDRARPRDLVAVAKRIELLTGVPAAWVLGLETPSPRQGGPDGGGGAGLPRLDSNQQPSEHGSSQVSDPPADAEVIAFPAPFETEERAA